MIAVPLGRNINKQYRLNKEINEIEIELARLTQKNKSYSELIKFLQSDQFVEAEARQNLNFKKEGENVAIIKNDSEDRKNSETDHLISYDLRGQDYVTPEATNPIRWYNYFFD